MLQWSIVDRSAGRGCSGRSRREILDLAPTRHTQVSVGLGPHRLMSRSMPVAGDLPARAARRQCGRGTDPGRKESTERVQHPVDTASDDVDRQGRRRSWKNVARAHESRAHRLARTFGAAGCAQDMAVSRVSEGDDESPEKHDNRRNCPRRRRLDVSDDRADSDDFDHNQQNCQTEDEEVRCGACVGRS